jgi:hypothetical protein
MQSEPHQSAAPAAGFKRSGTHTLGVCQAGVELTLKVFAYQAQSSWCPFFVGSDALPTSLVTWLARLASLSVWIISFYQIILSQDSVLSSGVFPEHSCGLLPKQQLAQRLCTAQIPRVTSSQC